MRPLVPLVIFGFNKSGLKGLLVFLLLAISWNLGARSE